MKYNVNDSENTRQCIKHTYTLIFKSVNKFDNEYYLTVTNTYIRDNYCSFVFEILLLKSVVLGFIVVSLKYYLVSYAVFKVINMLTLF